MSARAEITTNVVSESTSARPAIVRLPSMVLLGLIALYQRTISPLLPVVTAGACACRFAPTCSHYAAEAIRVHGAVRGAGLALRRLVKCTPLHPGGFDPVPIRHAAYSCDSVSAQTPRAPHGAVIQWSSRS